MGQVPLSGGGGLYLKEIELENFKSFGKHLRLPLLPGYTAITGPNGSGKSNLSDAILFVLGPKSGKVIRAGRLTDLIYNGGKAGTPAKSCRVSLVFDNVDRTIPLDEDEVRLTRFVGRSPSVEGGYNSYFYVNGRKANLQAFDDLLAHARISADGYNIIQQGDVAKVVDMSPVERRRVLEEMAGIAQFDEEIQKAEGKKQGVEDDLERIGIILREIQRQLKQLEEDREAALAYRETQERLELARAQEAYKEVQLLRQQLKSTRLQVERYTQDRVRRRAKREELLRALQEAEESLGQREEALAEEGGEEFRRLKTQLDDLRVARARAQDAIERGKEAARDLRRERPAKQRVLKKLHQEKKDHAAAQKQTTDEIRSVEAQLAELENQIETLQEEAAQGDDQLLRWQKELVALEKEIDTVEATHKRSALDWEKARQRRELLETRRAELEEEAQAARFELKDARWQLKEQKTGTRTATKDLEKLKQRAVELEGALREKAKQATELDGAVKQRSREVSQLRADTEAAANVARGYTRAVTTILEARDEGKIAGVYGTIAELASVRPEHEVALKVAAGARMQAIVVEDDETAAQAIQILQAGQVGRAIFLPLNKMVPGRPRGKAVLAAKKALGYALDLVEFDEAYRNAFWYVFGDTVVTANLVEARRLMGGVRLVTLDGQLVEASGAMIGGQVSEPPLRFGQVAPGRLEEARAELEQASQALARVNEEIAALTEELESLRPRLREAQEDHLGGQTHSDLLKQRVEALSGRVAKTEKAAKDGEAALQAVEQDLADLEEQRSAVADQLAGLQADRESKRKKAAASTPTRLGKQLRSLQAEKLASREQHSTLTAQAATLASELKLLQSREEELEDGLSAIAEGLSREQRVIENETTRLAEIEEEIQGLQNLEERSHAELREVQEERDRAFKTKTGLEADLATLESKLEANEDFLLSLEDQAATLRDRVAEAESRLEGQEAGTEDLPSLEEIRRTITRCEQALNSIGAVNLRALEDYTAQETRHAELEQELDRLKKERKDLLHLVRELEGKKKEGLLAVFQAVRTYFVEIYAGLSDGGEAEILLEEEEDPFAGGLVIRARPPRKRFLRLEALSGGEKSLVSMAFLFSLQAHEPSPFYFLDEVDQNLDAVNAERIAQMVRENASSAQFIQISLRKVSLKEADHILGVTMTDRAISRVIMQVNLEDVVEEGPPTAEVAA